MNTLVFALVSLLLCLPRPAESQTKTYNVLEETGDGTFVGNIARDLNLEAILGQDVFPTLKYSILAGEDGDNFRLDADNSDMFTRGKLDREVLCRFETKCNLRVRVAAISVNSIREFSIKVNLQDINDNAPTFNQSTLGLRIPESVTVGTKYTIPGALDLDRGETNSVQEYVLEEDGGGKFGVDFFQKLDGTSDVSLVILEALDREIRDMYQVIVVAKDGGNPVRSASLIITIEIEDDNDHIPEFPQKQYDVKIGENTVEGDVIIQLSAADFDIGVNGKVRYRLSVHQESTISELFDVNENSGELMAKVALTSGSYTIIVEAVDGGSPPKVSQTEVLVTVIDTDNNPPAITVDTLNSDTLNAYITEAANRDALVAHVSVFDPDSGQNGAVKCYSQSAFFDLVPLENNNHMVVVAKTLDREETSKYRVTLFCEDSGSPPLNATQFFNVVVMDVNDNPPVFEKEDSTIMIPEGNTIGDVATIIIADDKDEGNNAKIYFSLLDDSKGFFRIPVGSNALMFSKTLDRETQDTHVVKIIARDGGNPSESASATVTVSVQDVNDVEPNFFKARYNFELDEGLPAGSVVGTVSAFDLDLGEGGKVKFSLPRGTPADGKFYMLENGTLVTLTPLDREDIETFIFPVQASDNGRPSLSSLTEVQVRVLDINDNNPSFLFPSPSNNSVTLYLPLESKRSLVNIRAVDVDEGQSGVVFYSMLPGNASRVFRIDPATGELFARYDLQVEDEGTYNITVTATDRGDNPLSTSRTLMVHVKVNPELTPVQSSDTNAVIAISLVCGTLLLAAIIVAVFCFVRRRDKGKQLRYLDNKKSDGTVRQLDASALPSQYDKQYNGKNHSSNDSNSNGNITMLATGSNVLATYTKRTAPKLSVGFPGASQPDQYSTHDQLSVRVDRLDEPDTSDKELNRVTSLRLQQAFQHISSIKSRLITPSDTGKPYEWREIHIPGHPGDFNSLSSRATTGTNNNIDSGVGTDDDAVFLNPGSHRSATSWNPRGGAGSHPYRQKNHFHFHHHHHHHHGRFSSQPPSDLSGDSSQPSVSSLPNLCLRPSTDIFGFRPLSARSSESFPSEAVDDQCTTTSGSYSINMDDQQHLYHPQPHHKHNSNSSNNSGGYHHHGTLKMSDLGQIQDVYV